MSALVSVASIGWEVLDRFRFGDDIAISPHGLGIAIGFLAGSYVFVNRDAPLRGISEDQAGRFVFWALIGAIVGARFFYVLAHFSEFDNLADMLAIWRGGISLIGGITGSVLFGLPLMRTYRLPFLRVMDAAAIGLPLGIVIGRIGDLIIGDHLGKPTSWLLAFTYHGGNLSSYACDAGSCIATLSGRQVQTITAQGATLQGPTGELLAQGVGVHQTALYDFLSTMVLVLVLVALSRIPRRTGVLFLTFAAWYGSVRIITDFLRVDKRFFGLTGSQWGSAAVVVVSLATLAWFALRPTRDLPETVPQARAAPD
jgi:phosphatidylglycerol:prolipoprotein diacylglycerol transferase